MSKEKVVKEKKEPANKPTTDVDLRNFGYPQIDVKDKGIKIRGTGAATKGTMSRGPQA